MFSSNSVFLATTPRAADSISKNNSKVYIAHHDAKGSLLSPPPPTPNAAKKNKFLFQQNRILINYKKLTHFENCLLRSREFLKKNFDFIHAQIKAQAAVAATAKDEQEKLKESKKKKKKKETTAKKTKTLKSETVKEDTGAKNRDEKRNTSNIVNLKLKEQLNRKKCFNVEFSRGMVAFTLRTLKVLSEIDEV